METRLDRSTLEALNADLALETARAAVQWATDTFGSELCLLASMQDTVLIDIAMSVDSTIAILFLDNGLHFPETIDTVRRVEERYDINIARVHASAPPPPSVAPGQCCDLKVPLLEAALADRSAWLSGLRRSETATRATADLVETDRRGLTKINPLAAWTDTDTATYIDTHHVITNPLLQAGYSSVGCQPCTTPNNTDDLRGGRWAGSERTECGLHL